MTERRINEVIITGFALLMGVNALVIVKSISGLAIAQPRPASAGVVAPQATGDELQRAMAASRCNGSDGDSPSESSPDKDDDIAVANLSTDQFKDETIDLADTCAKINALDAGKIDGSQCSDMFASIHRWVIHDPMKEIDRGPRWEVLLQAFSREGRLESRNFTGARIADLSLDGIAMGFDVPGQTRKSHQIQIHIGVPLNIRR